MRAEEEAYEELKNRVVSISLRPLFIYFFGINIFLNLLAGGISYFFIPIIFSILIYYNPQTHKSFILVEKLNTSIYNHS